LLPSENELLWHFILSALVLESFWDQDKHEVFLDTELFSMMVLEIDHMEFAEGGQVFKFLLVVVLDNGIVWLLFSFL
jgi:hypothetical protein